MAAMVVMVEGTNTTVKTGMKAMEPKHATAPQIPLGADTNIN